MRLAILTGGSKGLGLALCQALTERRYRILEFSRSAQHAYSVKVDLSLPSDSRRIAASAIASLGGEHVEELLVINNAGTLDPIGPASRKERDSLREKNRAHSSHPQESPPLFVASSNYHRSPTAHATR